MIGDVPKGAPLRCKLGRHTGQERGGLMAFQCPRCGGTYWQTNPRYRAAMDTVRRLEDAEDGSALDALAAAGYAEQMVRHLEASAERRRREPFG